MSALIACGPAPILATVMSQPANQSTPSLQMLRRRVTALLVLSVVGYSGVKAMAEYFAGNENVVASISQGAGESLLTTDVPTSVTMPLRWGAH